MKMDLALNNLQGLICHKTKPNQELIEVKRVSIKKNTKKIQKKNKEKYKHYNIL